MVVGQFRNRWAGWALRWNGGSTWPGAGWAGDKSRREMFTALDAELTEAGPNSWLFFLPLSGGHDNPATTQRGGFVGLGLSHNRANMARAVLESAAFELRWVLEIIQQAGLPVERLWMIGGAAKSPHWPSILATVTEVPLSLPQYDNWPAIGAAVLAGVGVGLFKSVEDGLIHYQKPAQDVAPIEALRLYYDDVFETYKQHRETIGY